MASQRAHHEQSAMALPGWVPGRVHAYLAHTVGGVSLRSLARDTGGHASTFMRQIRRTEHLRDDPLADAALTRLGALWQRRAGGDARLTPSEEMLPMTSDLPDGEGLARDTLRTLKALLEPDTLLVIADNVEEAVVVKKTDDLRPLRRMALPRAVAETLALREFIAGTALGRLTRYTITAAGRAEAIRLMAEAESRRAAAQGANDDADSAPGPRAATGQGRRARGSRPVGAEAPLYVLAKRRRAKGDPWLSPALVAAGLRFRETFEIARLSGSLTRDWDRLLTGRVGNGPVAAQGGRATRRLEAEQSLNAAVRAVGPDLAETIILSVCEELGMEAVEDRLAFPARAGKLALRLALRRLAQHYDEIGDDGYDLIY